MIKHHFMCFSTDSRLFVSSKSSMSWISMVTVVGLPKNEKIALEYVKKSMEKCDDGKWLYDLIVHKT